MSIYEHKLHKCNNGDYYYSNLYTVCSGVKNMQWLIEDHALPDRLQVPRYWFMCTMYVTVLVFAGH